MKLKTEGDETMTIGCIVKDRTEISRYAKLYLKDDLRMKLLTLMMVIILMILSQLFQKM